MVEASEQLVAGGVVEGESAADARAEGEKLWGAESFGQSRIAGEDDAEQLLAVEVLAGQDAQLAEDGGEGFLCLVDDEHGPAAAGGDVIGPASAQGLESSPAIVRGEWDREEVAELAVEVHGAALGMLDGADDDVGQRAKALGEQAQGDALSGAWISSEHGEAAVGDAELDASDEAVDGGGREERVVRNVGAKRVKLQAVERNGALYFHESSGRCRRWCRLCPAGRRGAVPWRRSRP